MKTEVLTEDKKQDFRKYLEDNGTVDALTRALVQLFEEKEKPENAAGFISNQLNKEAEIEIQQLKLENDALKGKITELKEKLLQYEPEEAETSEENQAKQEEPAEEKKAK